MHMLMSMHMYMSMFVDMCDRSKGPHFEELVDIL